MTKLFLGHVWGVNRQQWGIEQQHASNCFGGLKGLVVFAQLLARSGVLKLGEKQAKRGDIFCFSGMPDENMAQCMLHKRTPL